MMAAYVLVLQLFLSFSMASQVAPQGGALFTGSFFVICSSHDGDTGLPNGSAVHCPICILSSAAGIDADPVLLPLGDGISQARLPFVSPAACLSFHSARAGLSRAPPQNA